MTQSYYHIIRCISICMMMYMSILRSDCQEIPVTSIQKKQVCAMTLQQEDRSKYINSIKDEQSLNRTRMDGTYNIPVQFHLLRRTNGTGGITVAEAAIELAEANDEYASFGVEFFQCSPANIINDDGFFNTEFDFEWESFCGQLTAEYLIAGQNNVPNVVNIYYVNTDGWNWSAFPSYVEDYCHDWIIMNIADIGNPTLLAHELGHYFNLLHTFQGYGDGQLNNHEHITRNSNDDCYNCNDYGDLLCDTPADHNTWDNFCNWDGVGGDVCSDLDFDPDEENIMSYSDCPNNFSNGQEGRIISCILTSRAYLDCPFLSDCEPTWNLSSTHNGTYAYQASNTITSTSDVNSSANSVYDAGNYVRLQPGFHAKAGSTFSAIVDGCWGPVIFP